ncbi:hypothetical protein [Psychroserpens luteolus]|uniref:hypothetical protein n=1 Tax=Psychroserpens luteolus TaxID=2855840 RepID=UPI001E322FC3|nr:hypothetical protein [Psychroserpens luteolus]MCD2258544.1 hypothetical protein [Psychroserpens luteolus]
MGKKKKKKNKKTGQKETLILIALSALISLAGLYAYFSENLEETAKVSGVFVKYEEKKRKTNKTRKTYYAVYLDDQKYTIPRIYISALNKEKFLAEVTRGDHITLAINDSKSIYQITKADTNYIDPNKLKEEVESNDFVGLIVGCFFLVCMGYLVYVYTKL